MGLAPPSSVSDWIYTLSCVSLQATKKPAHRQAGFLRTGRYTPCTDSLSRPIVGHTPRKLPPFGAISRIIATASLTDAPLSYNTQPCVSRGFEKNFGGFPGICRGCFVNFPKKQDEVPPERPSFLRQRPALLRPQGAVRLLPESTPLRPSAVQLTFFLLPCYSK